MSSDAGLYIITALLFGLVSLLMRKIEGADLPCQRPERVYACDKVASLGRAPLILKETMCGTAATLTNC
jgi:hypothetical protein